tara:strand:- start:383 stop:655 length:273 start_codon:yes stop_codon:yes gene_type:complete
MALTSEEKDRAKFVSGKGKIAQEVTLSDSAEVSDVPFNIYVGTGGDLKVDTEDGQTVTLKNVPSGTYIDFIKIKKIYSTGTRASDIVAIH